MNEAKSRFLKNKKHLDKFEKRFLEIFKHSITDFQDGLGLFDIRKFDKEVIHSAQHRDFCANVVRKNYGIAGARLMSEILGISIIINKVKKINKIRS